MLRLTGNDRKNLATAIKRDIDSFCIETYNQEYRDHLGASTIGEVCLRRLVYSFRWMHREQFDGRMLRLFNRGHETEPRFEAWLKGIGAQVWTVNNDGSQFRMPSANPHYGGSVDGVAKLPERYEIPFPFLLEMKTHNDRSFKYLVKQGVKVSKPKHFVQMNAYGEAMNLDYAIYCAINKNDDDVWIEVVALDRSEGQAFIRKADHVISASKLPPRIAATIAYAECKYCPMGGVCHQGVDIDINCRSCDNSLPLNDGTWYCNKWGATIPHDAIPLACGEWRPFE